MNHANAVATFFLISVIFFAWSAWKPCLKKMSWGLLFFVLGRLWPAIFGVVIVIASSGCAGYKVGIGVGYTSPEGSRYDGAVTVERDSKVVRKPKVLDNP